MPVRELTVDELQRMEPASNAGGENLKKPHMPDPSKSGAEARTAPTDEARTLSPAESDALPQRGGARELTAEELDRIEPERGPLQRFGDQAMAGLASLPGQFLELQEAKLGITDPAISGQQQITNALSDLGVMGDVDTEAEPETTAGAAGRFTGETVPYIIGGPAAFTRGAAGQLGRLQAPARGLLGNARQAVTRFGEDIARTARERPARFAAGELGGAAGAGAGGHIASEQVPDSDAAELVGEVLGGLSPTVMTPTPTITALRAGANVTARLPVIRKVLGKTFKPKELRARERIERADTDPEGAAREMDKADVIPGLTPAQQTGRPGLLELERSVLDSSDELRRRGDDQIRDMDKLIRESMRETGGDVPIERTREALEEAQGHLASLLDTRLRLAAQRADERLQAVSPGTSRERANVIAREELGKALKDARAQERELYSAIPADVEVPTANIRRALQRELANLGKAQRGDIPSVARRLLSKESDDYLGAQTTIREMRGLQSKLRERSRQARSRGQFNAARIADDLANSITDDVARAQGGEDVAGIVDNAVSFSRTLHDRFSRGVPGRILKSAREGGAATPESLTLETTLFGSGPRARENFRQMRNAVREDPAQFEGAVEDYVKDEFLRSAFPGDEFNARSAKRFMERNRDLLEEFPRVRADLQKTVETQDAANALRRRTDSIAARLRNPRVSKATLLIQKSPDDAFAAIEQSRHPGREVQNLINMARRDQSGEALEGLKTAYIDRLLRQAEVTRGEHSFISGRRFREALGRSQPVARRLLSDGERSRLNKALSTAERLDAAREAKPSKEGVIGDIPGNVTSMLSRVMSAQAGRMVAERTGGGTVQTPGIFVGQAAERLRNLVADPAKRLLTDAITAEDGSLMRALLLDEVKAVPKARAKTSRRLHGWLATVLADAGLPEVPGLPEGVTTPVREEDRTMENQEAPQRGELNEDQAEELVKAGMAKRRRDGSLMALPRARRLAKQLHEGKKPEAQAQP